MSKTRILYVCRLYSGFENGLKDGVWQPKGAPTIAKMIEHLDTDPRFETRVVLTCKDYGSSWVESRDKILTVKGLNRPLWVLAGDAYFPAWLWKFRTKLNDIRQLYRIWTIFHSFKPDLVYFDRVNILPAACFARLSKTPVIWRVMGVLEQMRQHLASPSWRSALMRFLFKSPFSAVICTLDGSGGGSWMDRALSPKTQKHLLINGVDFSLEPQPAAALPEDKVKVLFAGRLEGIKGFPEFVDAMLNAMQLDSRIHAVVVGEGPLRTEMEQRIQKIGKAQAFSFLGSLSPAQLRYVRQSCDIYVSLNKQGNLSNVNLEALSDGMACIVPSAQMQSGIDVDTGQIVPDDVFLRFGKVGETQKLVDAILYLSDSGERLSFSEKAGALSRRILPSWDMRVQQEIAIYQDIVTGSLKD